MAALWICEPTSMEQARSNTFNREQLLRRDALIHDSASNIRRRSNSRRVLQVLVVGTAREVADELAKQADLWGHSVRVAYDGAAGLHVAAAQHPDVVVMDIDMPLFDKFQVAKQMRFAVSPSECFIIALSEWSEGEPPPQCSEAGIDLLLRKPIDPSILESLLKLEYERVNRS